MPELSPFQPVNLALLALLNPAVLLVGFLMGRQANQWQKLIVAGFAAALCGAVLVWVAVWLGVLTARGIGGEAGLFAISVVVGTIWAAIGYATRPRNAKRS